MTLTAWLQFVALIAVLAATAPPLGGYLAAIYNGGKAPGDRVFLPVERLIYRLARVDAGQEQRWTTYAFAVLGLSAVSFLVLYLLQQLQAVLPLNPLGLPAVPENVAFNTAVSFMTNTNWQGYGGESTMGYLVQ
ncbi:MAG: potassium-transporting ATPase subunit KdpA, partial [Propionibacteriaceae bacterium]|nr:potassium-transporting ATPase subunit KdpA [Propionibacteriaceae bacterium]